MNIGNPQVGDLAPEFLVTTEDREISLSELAARHMKLIVMSYDSYRYHPG
jgi:hypothetical protein